MNRNHPVLEVCVVVLVLVNTVSTGAVAQTQTHQQQVLLDTDVTEVATVHTNGQAFVVYEYDNVLPYASGIEVYADGEQVTSRETLDEVFRALARRRATKFEPEDRTIERLRDVTTQSERVQESTTNALSALNSTFAYRETLKEKTVNETSAWEVATGESEALEETFARGMFSRPDVVPVRKKLVAVRASARSLETDAAEVITLLERREQGAEINQSKLYQRYDDFYADLTAMKTRIDNVRNSLSETAGRSRTAASQASDVPEVGGELERRLTTVADELEAASERLGEARSTFVDLRKTLPEVSTDRRYQAQLTERWKQRQGAVTEVYLTVTEGAVVLAAAALTMFERRP